jgi:MoaA/NifB/PqqE/SkfB family radical SAM enzyme
MSNKREDIIFLKITNSCNLGCSYCIYNHNNDGLYINENKIDQIMFYHINKGYNKKYRVDLIGGEPTYNPAEMYRIINYLLYKYDQNIIQLNIITNAINLDDNMIFQLKKNKKIVLSISYDGDGIYNRYNKTISLDIRNKIIRYSKEIPITVYTVIGINQNYNPLIDIYTMSKGMVRQRIFEDHRSYTLNFDDYKKYIDIMCEMWRDYISYLNYNENIIKMPLANIGKYIHLFYRGVENDGSFDICSYKVFSDIDDVYDRCARYNYIKNSGIDNPCIRCTSYGKYLTERKRDIEKEVIFFEYKNKFR